MLMRIQVVVFWVVMLCSHVVGYQHVGGIYCHIFRMKSEDGGSMVLQNVGILLYYSV
jgi:hypothetical protein